MTLPLMGLSLCNTIFERFPRKASHEPVQFGLDRLFDQLRRSVAQNIGKSVG
ncbi:hypothetical protein HAT86_10900 [Roseovarius gahaiensis]|uniref:Uncharacterized protein n=1 Tax=Roseovarius gahaiensis TaxID=2716691 RepID=A0A967BHC5_9RHOB|nr:hypothetical protein [Roseovarius gahaiensis]NHQ74968.1 hypothetical protein [Roseovarius gahaiensis]